MADVSNADPTKGADPEGYQLGWNDGYAEGYGCKLADVSAPFMPSGDASEIEAVADWLQRKYGGTWLKDRSEAIGMARGMTRVCRERQQ